mgnify:CR=1 FL=1
MSSVDKINLATVRQSYAQTVFTHQVQEAAAARVANYAKRFKYFEIALPVIVIALLTAQTFQLDNMIFVYISSGVAVVEFALLLIQLNYNFSDQSGSHKLSALRYMGLRDEYRALISDIMNAALDQKMIIRCRDELQSKYQQISDMSPVTLAKDYNSAQLGLLGKQNKGEQYTWSDKEIDRFLPEELRIAGKRI